MRIGPWLTQNKIDSNRPSDFHPSPESDVDAAHAISDGRATPLDVTPDDQGEYGLAGLMAVMVANVSKMNDMLTRNRDEPFSFDVTQANEWVRKVPRGVIKCIVNPTVVAISVGISESTGPGATVIGASAVFAPGAVVYCYIPFVRGLFCNSMTAAGLKLNGVYTQGS